MPGFMAASHSTQLSLQVSGPLLSGYPLPVSRWWIRPDDWSRAGCSCLMENGQWGAQSNVSAPDGLKIKGAGNHNLNVSALFLPSSPSAFCLLDESSVLSPVLQPLNT